MVIHGHSQNEVKKQKGIAIGKVILLPNSVEELLKVAEKEFGKKGSRIFTEDGAEVEELCTLRDNDHLYIY